MKTVKTVKAEFWELPICRSSLDMVHGCYETIREIYIPKHKLSVNVVDKTLHVFESDRGRYKKDEKRNPIKLDETELTEEFVNNLLSFINTEKELYDQASKVITDLEK